MIIHTVLALKHLTIHTVVYVIILSSQFWYLKKSSVDNQPFNNNVMGACKCFPMLVMYLIKK